MRTCIIFNPTARGEKARRFRRHLDEIGAQTTLKLTTAVGDARRLAAEAVAEGFETVVAAGGDGTVNEVLNGMGDVPGGFESARLGVLPLGTVNVFARELGVPLRLMAAWDSIRRGRETKIDLPRAEFVSNGDTKTRYFAQLAGAGLDARAIELVEWQLKKRIGPLAYVWAGLRALRGKPSEIIVNADGERVTGGLVVIGNGMLYGGPFRLFPRADLRDGLLDVCIFPRVSWLTVLRCGPQLLWSRNVPASAAKTLQAKKIQLGGSARVPMQVDGELVGELPASFCAAGCVRVVVP